MHDVSGRTVILGTLALALAMAAIAWGYQYQTTRRAAAFWGPKGVEQLLRAKQIVAYGLGEPSELPGPGRGLVGREVLWERDLSGEPGLEHLRHAFTQDRNFIWPAEAIRPGNGPAWAVALQFGQGDRRLVVLLDARCRRLGKLSEHGRIETVDAAPMAPVVRKYFELIELADAIGVEPAPAPADR